MIRHEPALRERIHRITDTICLVQGGSSNWIIVQEETGAAFTLIDGGYTGDYPLLLSSIHTLGLEPADCAAALATHGHVDHIGGLARLSTDFDVPVWCHRLEADNLVGLRRDQVSLSTAIRSLWRPGALGWLRGAIGLGGLQPLEISPTALFNGGDILADLPGRPEVVHVPGHTRGSCAFIIRTGQGEVAVTGDALVTGHELLPRRQQPTMLPKMFTRDPAEAQRSFARLCDLRVRVVLPGHGTPYIRE